MWKTVTVRSSEVKLYSIYCVPYESTRKDVGNFNHEQTVFEETYLCPQIKNLDYIYQYHMVPHQNEHFFNVRGHKFKSLVYGMIWKKEREG